jgi:hypothetical protein
LLTPGVFIGTYRSISFSKYNESIPSECPPTSFHLPKILNRPGSDPNRYSSTPVFHSKVDFNENFEQHPVLAIRKCQPGRMILIANRISRFKMVPYGFG